MSRKLRAQEHMDEQNRKLCDTVSTMELPEDFDPRVDHFNNPDAKRYSGLGGELQASVDGGKVKLRVLRVPKSVTKEDLENVFTKLRCPFNVETKLNHRSHFLDAVVEFNSMGDAERAIRKFSNKEPLKFELVVVVSKDKKMQKLEVVKEPPAIANDNQVDQSVQINSVEALEPLVPVLCTMWKSWNNIVELKTGALGRMFAPSISLPNKSKVCDGRVCFIPPPAYFEKSNSGNDDNADDVNSNKTNSFIACGKEAELPERYDHRPCVVCGLLTSSICIPCKTVNYCCPECQAKDWKKHKLVCKKKDKENETVKRNELAVTESETVRKSGLPGDSKSINKYSHTTESVRRPKRRNCILSRFLSELNDTLPEKMMSNENYQNSNGFNQNNISQTSKSVCDSNGVKKVTPTSPFYIEGQVYEVFAQSVLDSREFFATRLDLKEHLETIHSELNREMSDSCQQLENVAVRSKCAVKYGGLWYRALVRKLDPLTVRCIDFGFDKTCKPADLKELPAKFKTALLTVLVRLISDASVAKIRSSFKLHFIRKDGNHWLVEFANEHPNRITEIAEQKPSLPSNKSRDKPKPRTDDTNSDLSFFPDKYEEDSRLNKFKNIIDASKENDTVYCQATRVLSDTLFTCIIKPEEAQHFVKQIHRLDLGNPLIEPYRPQLNEMVAIYSVHTDPFWRRGIVLSESNGLYNLALVDFGLPVISKDLKKLSDYMENIPLMSVKLRLNSSPSFVIQQEDVLRVTLVKKLADSGEWEAEVYSTGDEPKHLGAGRVSRWNIEPDQVPELATLKLESGDAVVISSFQEVNKMYVRPANPELAEFYLMLEADLAAEFTLGNCLGRPPFTGELVAIVWHHDCKHYRARILEKTDKKDHYKVLFVDHGNTDIIHTSRMMLISNKLKSIPVCAIEVGLAAIEFKSLTPAAYDYIIKLAAHEELLIVTFENHKGVQLTKVSDKTDLNKRIRDLLEPSWLREPHFNTSLALLTYPMLMDLPLPAEENRFKIGETESIILSYVPPFDSSSVRDGRIQLVACKASKELIVTYTKVLCDQMSEYIASQQNGEEINKYVPHRGELCVCLGEDNIPIRAECVSLLNDKSARLAYIDYGHQVDVKFERIYKMTNDLMQLPAYATYCYAEGFPADTTPEKLAAAYNELNFCDAEIKGFENEHYNIFIPELIARV